MLGKRSSQRDLFDVGNVFPLELDPKSFHGQLAHAAPRLFQDADFASFLIEGGRPSVLPAELALLALLQHEAGWSDEEAVLRSAFDLRWAAVLGRAAATPLCAKSTLQLFRSHLVLNDGVPKVFQKSIAEARRAGLLKGPVIRAAIDTKPMLGRGAVQDTYNLLGTSMRQLATRSPPRRDRRRNFGPASTTWAATFRIARPVSKGAPRSTGPIRSKRVSSSVRS